MLFAVSFVLHDATIDTRCISHRLLIYARIAYEWNAVLGLRRRIEGDRLRSLIRPLHDGSKLKLSVYLRTFS